MEKLKLIDLIALSKADEETKIIQMSSREVFSDPFSRERLVNAGMISLKGDVTDSGLATIQSIRKKEVSLRNGIPFLEKAGREVKRLCRETTDPWIFVMIGKDQIVSNGELLFVGTPEPAMKASRGNADLQEGITEVIRRCAKGEFKQLWPHSYQSFSLGGVDLIWLVDETQDLMISVQAKYFDFVSFRFSKSIFWGSSPEVPVQVKVRGKGMKNSVVAIIATFDVAGELKNPRKIDGWRKDEEMQESGVSNLEERNRGSLREGEEE